MTPIADRAAEPDLEQWLKDFADLAYLLGHEFNNFLNNLFLHLSILEVSGPESKIRSEAEAIRHLGRALAVKVHQFQQLSRKHRPPPEPVDLNAAVRAAAGAAQTSGLAISLELADSLPAVLSTASDLKHLVELLLQAATTSLPVTGGQIFLKTQAIGPHAVLSVTDNGKGIGEKQLPKLFEPFEALRPGSDGLKLAICRALVRRLQGNIHAENREGEEGLSVVVELPLASPKDEE
jgi:signal transduction histidine kinase